MAKEYEVGKAPWEQKPQEFDVGSAPWETQTAPAVVDEMHPEITFKDRAIYKNFAVDPEAGFNYLQKQYPQLNFKKDDKGEVLAKKPEETAWKKLDPSGFDLQDITDVAWDVPAGFVESAATALGGIAGGAAGAPSVVGAVPGALLGGAAAGAATGAGLETARQGIGNFLGVADGMSGADIGTSAAFGAVSPLLFGTGGIAKSGAKVLGKEITEEAAEQLTKSQRGALGAGFDYVKGSILPKLGQAASGVDSEVLKWASEPKNLQKIKEAQGDIQGVTIFDDLSEKFIDSADDKRGKIGLALGKELDKIKDIEIDTGGIVKEFQDLVGKYKTKAENLGTKSAQEDFMFVEQALNNYVPADVIAGGKINASKAFSLKDSINDISGIRKAATEGLDTRAFKQSVVEKDLERVAKITASKLDSAVNKLAESGGSEVKALRKQYADSIKDTRLVNKLFATPEKSEASLKSIITSGGIAKKKGVGALSKRLGIDISDTAKEAVAIGTFAKPNITALSSGGTVSTGRMIPLAAAGAITGGYLGNQAGGIPGGAVGGSTGALLGAIAGGPAAMRNYMRLNAAANRAGRSFQRALPGPAATGQTGLNIWQQMNENER